MGITVMAQPEITDAGQLKGRRAGTFRRDPLEVLLHDVHGGPWTRLRRSRNRLPRRHRGRLGGIRERRHRCDYPCRAPCDPCRAQRRSECSATVRSCGAIRFRTPFSLPRPQFLESRPRAGVGRIARDDPGRTDDCGGPGRHPRPCRTALSGLRPRRSRSRRAPPAPLHRHLPPGTRRFTIAGIRSSRWGSSLEATSRRPMWFHSICWRSSWNARAVRARIHPETKHQRRSRQ